VTGSKTAKVACLLILLTGGSLTRGSAAAVLPQDDAHMHMGVSTCASSNCHASSVPEEQSNVQQSEYTTWLFHDRHAKAFRTLESDESKQIARKLGIGKPWQAPLCLNCHADNVAIDRRGPEFQISDGVGCEACHGGSQLWLSRHTLTPYDAERNHVDGMYPTDNLAERTKLCASCHVGNSQKFATHEIMGAGHPRLGFELDAFTQRQPAHYQVDGDYIARKFNDTGVQRMLVGTAATAQSMASNLTGVLLDHEQGYPEISLFDCYSCHHSLSDVRWQPRINAPNLKPGTVILNDGVFRVLAALLGAIDRPAEVKLLRAIRQLHTASQVSIADVREAALALGEQAEQAQSLFAQRNIDKGIILKMLNRVVQLGIDGGLHDYIAAEHAVMCLDTLSQQLDETPKLTQLLDQAYALLANDDDYSAQRLRMVMRKYAKYQ